MQFCIGKSYLNPLQLSDVQVIIDYSLAAFRWLQENFPGYVLWAQDTGTALAQVYHFLYSNIYVVLTFCTIGNIVQVPISIIPHYFRELLQPFRR